MKTFNKVKSLPWIIISTVFIILTLSCEIGLGPAVDTEPPRLEISTPSPDAVIRGDFKIGGNWSDDGTIESVVVTMKRTDGNGTSTEFVAEFKEGENDNLNTWGCVINPLATKTLLDGNYIAQVDITDAGKHTTTKTVQFTIDNTPPVIVLQRPSTKADATQPDSYGQKFTLEGQAADDNSISQIELQVFSDKECTNRIHTVPLTNVPNSINLDVAEFAENVENVYSQIYGSTTKDGEKGFFCKIVAYDGAAYYPSDGNQTPEDLKGNSTDIYYLYEDIATSILSTTKLPEVYHILSGVYDLSSDSPRSTAVSSNTVKDNLAKNQLKVGSFTLNPENNPTFTVAGKEPLVRNEEGTIAFTGGDYDITNGSQIIMEVTPGLDSIPLDGNSLKIYFIECDDFGKAKSDATKVYPSTEVKKSGTTYKFTVSIAKVDGLIIGKNYLCGVEGYDEKKNSVVSSDSRGYGFHFTTSGAAPGLTITKPEEGSVTLSKGKTLLIEGTTTVEAGVPVITIVDNKETKKTITFTESQATEDEDKKLVYKFSAEIPFEGTSAYHELDIISDIEGIKTTRSKTVSYDCDAPVIKINAVSPIVEKSDENGQSDGKKYLNGEVQITFSLTDDFSFIDTTTNKPYFELWQNDAKKYTGSFTSTNSTVTETVKLDTKKLTDKADLEIKVFAWDRAGNKSEYSSAEDGIVYSIDQSTDKPIITPKSNINFALNSEDAINDTQKNSANANKISAGSTVSFMVTDDDGIEYIEVNLLSKDENGKIKEELVSRYPEKGSANEVQTPFSFNLPTDSGFHSYRISVKDIISDNADSNNSELYDFMIKATSPAPTIELQSTEDETNNYDNKQDGYIKNGGAYKNTITIKSTEAPFTVYQKGSQEAEYEPIAKNLDDTKYEDTVSPTETTTYYYKVIDANGQTSNEKTIDCKVDTTAPEITPGALPGKQDTRVKQFTFSGTAADSDSGVKQVEIYFANEDETFSKSVTAGGTVNWYYTLTYSDESLKEIFGENYGKKFIKFKVTDNVGLSTETEVQSFYYDTQDPNVSITHYIIGTDEKEYKQGSDLKLSKEFGLKGIVSDDWGIQSIKIVQNPGEKNKQNIEVEIKDNNVWEVTGLPRNSNNETDVVTGGYEYEITVIDKANNEVSTKIKAYIDITPPEITLDTIGVNNYVNSSTKKFTGTVKDGNSTISEITLLDQDGNIVKGPETLTLNQNSQFEWTVYDIQDGKYKIKVHAEDDYQNERTIESEVFTVDATIPSTTISTSTSIYNKEGVIDGGVINEGNTYYTKESKISLSGIITEENLYSISVNGAAVSVLGDNTWKTEININNENVQTYTIQLIDNAGNQSVYNFYLAKDISAPVLSVTNPTSSSNLDSISVSGIVTDSGIGVKSVKYELYKLTKDEDGKEIETPVEAGTGIKREETGVTGQFTFNKETPESIGQGNYRIKVSASDLLGNTSEEQSIDFSNDITGPVLTEETIETPAIKEGATIDETSDTYTVYGTRELEISVKAVDEISEVQSVKAETGGKTTYLTYNATKGVYEGTVSLQSEKGKISIIAQDKFSNTNSTSLNNIYIDEKAPDLTINSVVEITNKPFTISGTVKDAILLASTDAIKITDTNDKGSVNVKEYIVTPKTNGEWALELTPNESSGVKDGKHTFTVEAKDAAGNKTTKTVTVTTDVTPPTWKELIDSSKKSHTVPYISSTIAYEEKEGETVLKTYYKSNSINIAAKAVDATSGVKCLVYQLDNGGEQTVDNANFTIENIEDGEHNLTILAEDEAGNKTAQTSIQFYIDTKSPEKPTLISLDSESGDALTDYINEEKSKLVNGKNDVKFVLQVKDASTLGTSREELSSGINSVVITKIGSNSLTSNPISGTKNSETGNFEFTIPADPADGGVKYLASGSVYIKITDNAGNSYEGSIFTIQKDDKNPAVKISSPASEATVNKTITVSGNTTDNNAVAKTVVNIYKGEAKATNSDYLKEITNSEQSNEQEWTFELDTFNSDFNGLGIQDSASLTIEVIVTDTANNSTTVTQTVTVDQNSDRPVIRFNNIQLGSSMSSSNNVWLKNTTSLYGTVEDDDGINSMYISQDGTTWTTVTVSTNNAWSFDIQNFFDSDTENKANKSHKIYFKVIDSKEKEFISKASSDLDSIYLVDGENKYGTSGKDSILYLTVDTLPPEVILQGARIGDSGDFVIDYSKMTLGGDERIIEFKLTATDGNGIEEILGTAEFSSSTTISNPTVTAYTDSGKTTTIGASDVSYYTVKFTLDLTGAENAIDKNDGRITLRFTGKDKAGNSSIQIASMNFDYKKPEVGINSPTDENYVSGIVTAYGTIDSTATMYYALSPSNTISPVEADVVTGGAVAQSETSDTDSNKVTSWEGIDPDSGNTTKGTINITPKYTQIRGNGVQWFVYFDNGTTTDLATHDVDTKKYLTNYGITTDDAISNKEFKTIVKLYLWIKSIDEAGNITETKFPILIDPQGDAPQVEISYPAKSGETLGGAVTLLGTASDTIGSNIGIKNVWVQIMSDTSDTNATPTKGDVNLWINKGYSVYTNIKNGEPTKVTTEIADSATPANYYIQATVSGTSWSLKINAKDEFSPIEGSTKYVAYRVYAQDYDNNLSKVQTQYCIFDADNPVLSDLYLRQYSDNVNGTGDITASRPYEDDMWIKDDWWLCGTVKDTQGIASLTVNDVEQTVSGGEGHEETFKYKISTNGKDAGNNKITIVATDNVKDNPHPTRKECSINFDNKAPVSKEPVIANNKIQNANGFFTFSAEVTEDAVGGAAQSGFKYLAFYFTRGNNVYDIMRPKADGKSAVDKSDTSKFATEDGLIWKKLSVTRSENNLSVITLQTADDNIHTGGLCKIGGSIYMIKNVNGTTIELDGSPEMPASGPLQEALFAIANVVNNNIESGNGTKFTNDSYYGYFESISNDDGDHMVESVLKTGTTWKWEANINSRNIPDGTVTLHYVAFDAAGNFSAKEIPDLQIANNAPRLASLKVWTDYNGNGQQDENEFDTKYYSKKTVVIGGKSQTKSQDLTSDLLLSGNDKDDSAGGSAFMTIKAEAKLIPELVGGNGDLYYTYQITNNTSSLGNFGKTNGPFATGNDDGIDDEAGNGGYYVVDDENTAYISGTMYDGTNGKNPIVITKEILESLNNNSGNDNPTWFEYTIYDSTEGCANWSDVSNYTKGRLSAKFKVALNVQYNDEVAPKVAIRPFYWNSRTENSVVWDNNSGKPLGHIELEGDLTVEIKTALGDEDPKVSGKIKIEGYAFDNIKLKELYVQFAGHKDIDSKVLAATYGTNGIWDTATGIGDTWDFEAKDVFNNSEGHLVYWTLTVDTQAVSGTTSVARLDQKVTVVAKDERGKQGTTSGGLESATSGTETSGTETNQKMLWKDVKSSTGAAAMFYTDVNCQTNVSSTTTDDTQVYLKEKWDYKMDIVPYVTGVKTSLSGLDRKTPSKFDRTALGHYPVRIVTKTQSGSTGDAETVTFEGFNLGSNTELKVDSLEIEDDSTTGGKSAKYVPVVNEIPAINNMNNNNAKGSYEGDIGDDSSYYDKNNYAYNRQPNNANNNKLTDDIIFDVWEFNSAAAVPISGKIEQPVMKIRPTDGKIGFAFVNGPLYFSMGGSESKENYSYQYWMGSYDFFTSVGFTYDDAGNSWGVAAGGDINSTSADKFQLMSSKWGRASTGQSGSYSNTNSRRLESIGQRNSTGTREYDKQRIKSPSMVTSIHNNNTNLYLAYYDAMNNEIRFKSGSTDGTSSVYEYWSVEPIQYIDANFNSWNYGHVQLPLYANSYFIGGTTQIYFCDKEGNLCNIDGTRNNNAQAYTIYKANHSAYNTDWWFKLFSEEEKDEYAFPTWGGFTENDKKTQHYPNTEMFIKFKRKCEFGNFDDYDIMGDSYYYRNSTVNIVAGDGVKGYGAGEYVSLGVVPGSAVDNDIVVITWYDTNARTLYYSYNKTPLTNRSGTYNAADGNTGWSKPVAVFSDTDYDYAGEYCKIAVDKNGGIHIAAYDPVNLDLVYAYASSYSSSFTTCVVDSNGVVGSNLTLDVALENGNAVPFIGYYATSCIKPKYARFVGGSLSGDIDGSKNDEVTGKWEISVVPTSSIIEMQSNQHNDINIGVWKNSGAITNSTTGGSSTNNQPSSYSSVSNGQIYGNGTKNPVLGYAIKYGSSSDTIETAQMK